MDRDNARQQACRQIIEIESTHATSASDLQLDGNEYQALRGFGGCFNELGWLPLQTVTEKNVIRSSRNCSARMR
ncbi:MAG: hypothetical protein ACLS6O_04005 [Bifidobacterium sp.]